VNDRPTVGRLHRTNAGDSPDFLFGFVSFDQPAPFLIRECDPAVLADLAERTPQAVEIVLLPLAATAHDSPAIEVQQPDTVVAADLQVVRAKIRMIDVRPMKQADAVADGMPDILPERAGLHAPR